jgi:hypothetical protein
MFIPQPAGSILLTAAACNASAQFFGLPMVTTRG